MTIPTTMQMDRTCSTFPENNGTFDWDFIPGGDWSYWGWQSPTQLELPNWEFLSASDCLQAYAVDFLSDHRNVMVVGNYTTNDEFLIFGGGLSTDFFVDADPPFQWICSGLKDWDNINFDCSSHWREIDPSNWQLEDTDISAGLSFQVKYCLSSTVVPRCQLQFNLPLLVLVIIFNIGKVICMVIAATKMNDHPLVTIGDAIESFLKIPSEYTQQMCLISQNHFRYDSYEGYHNKPYSIRIRKTQIPSMPQPIKYQPMKIRWLSLVSRRHWIMTVFLFSGAILIILSLLGFAIHQLSAVHGISGFLFLWQLGIGKASTENIIQGWGLPTQGYDALIASVLIANSPQLILSMIYLVFNGLCTKMMAGFEWSSYAYSHKPLRVSEPHGDQKSTYFLQIPYRFGLPLMAYSALLHWLVSQSIFLVAVTFWDGDVIDTALSIISCGFSPIAMMLTSIVAGSLILSALALGYFKHINYDMPLMGSNSVAIAAACHPPRDDSDPLKPVRWGVVTENREQTVGHISFSSGKVTVPVPGNYYS
ncbi:hypothetical protein BT96DRAFT_355591 [Gymnopus androsaceus JB14]|uniref:Uncharacterized protein n=1 Tax=Gymnopus androsaceus JB14 TaxID=1447944 RepID=A0A6A4GW23_9AGAR|nr:hypothetical protein BT96DRAFT_355591 [Gymnopus androsaceus JB14]